MENKNFGKIENGILKFAPLPLVIDGVNFWTNDSQKYYNAGYFDIVRTKAPEKEGYYYSFYWALEDNKCVMKWEEHEITEEISTDSDYAEAAKILLGEAE